LIVSAGWLAPGPVPLDEAVSDYAQMVRIAVVDATPDDAGVVRRLKVVAQRFDIVLVVTVKTALINAPLNRTERPRLADLRGPANLAELADLVIALYRDDMFDARSKRPGEADLEILKHRYGPTRELPPIAFQGHYARFVEMRT
jgi:replicative DNA helicase